MVRNGVTNVTALPEDGQAAKDVAEVLALVDRGVVLTRQIRAFSGSEPVVTAVVTDLNTLVQQSAPAFERTAGAATDVEYALEPELGPVRVDAPQIRDVLIGLAANARDAMPEGGALTIGTRNDTLVEGSLTRLTGARPGPYVAVTVRDTGSGMTDATLAHAFEPFFTTKDVGEGNGLGLSVAYGVARRHEGFVTLDSKVGQGTTVTIYLPRVDDAGAG